MGLGHVDDLIKRDLLVSGAGNPLPIYAASASPLHIKYTAT
jgi:hypothetical protein